ncbi:MAG: ATP-binding protein [Bacteroidetes bacterium]|nr:ATP-binding protein [Bacteroidota bacterium]
MILGYIDIESISQKMVLESNLESVHTVEKLISRVKDEYAISDDNYNDIWIALNEAVSNAIKHGNKFNPAKKVRLTIETKEDRYLCFTIKDEGDGFNPADVPNPTSPDRIGEPNGRGVFLIHKLADTVTYSENGTCVEIGFDLYKN